jgi:hypothetical protein
MASYNMPQCYFMLEEFKIQQLYALSKLNSFILYLSDFMQLLGTLRR